MKAVINSVLSSLLNIYGAKYYFFVFAAGSHIMVESLTNVKDVWLNNASTNVDSIGAIESTAEST
ncbi:MAG TPA: hypothetical protein VFI73_00375 [Candidatus Nitrosopolaris sp.]|nr:hypothetical protein [Candidatus Nitrosopolaris sp.]